ncbi:DNA-binding protein [Fibrobacter succinogenes subsp. succinogenes S85]|jgi:transcriptional regulator with XRE-family HTH domain|uniref:DNA-binding protein n=1 Tax=Fibrobacter succinogenes (strain ATCC 19169 / S85) TaxID=59374 RepID=C9RLL8_FIBSS|nr:helix-turn-helix domain-containing protein [Fibrobacter succinogenes]ACX76033.1 transcriptional regulator, XRE family [Fibrobacter succinogenes subsp. succinogenes S85]ADL25661.1 DNA-binding protein [Fibrobacter succinogenes subsp. succinogenes S85]
MTAKALDSFGFFISEKRRELGISLRKFADMLGKAPSYVCDIEKGKKNPIEKEFLEKIASILNLSENDRNQLFDLSATARRDVAPTDLTEYIKATPLAAIALRSAKNSKITDDQWRNIINIIQKGK